MYTLNSEIRLRGINSFDQTVDGTLTLGEYTPESGRDAEEDMAIAIWTIDGNSTSRDELDELLHTIWRDAVDKW